MCKRLMCLTSFLLVLALTGNALADLIDHWKFDGGSGNTAINSVAGGVDGTINGATWFSDPPRGVALSFDGVDDVVNMVGYKAITGGASRSMCLWFKTDGGGTGPNGRGLLGWGTPQGSGVRWELTINMQGGARIPGALRINASSGTRTCETVVTDSEWHHATVTLHDDGSPTSEEMYVYLDGVEESYSQTNAGVAIDTGSDADVRVGNGVREDQNGFFSGLINDVRIYDHALTEVEILAAMAGTTGGYPFALSPNPADGALVPNTWVTLTWSPGDFAVSHDVYLGDNCDDVDNGTGDTFRGNQTSTMFIAGFPGFAYPDGLVPGTTYYWRIDEVNEADPNSPWKGPVWSFSIPPKTAYNPKPADGAEFVDPNNVTLSWTPGFGAILHTVYFGDNYDEVSNAAGGAPLGSATYKPDPLALEKVYYWRVDEFDAVETHKGHVWSFTTPGAVGNPQPTYGATDVPLNAILNWTPAETAASHELYFGTVRDAVRNADTSAPEYKGPKALGAESYDPGLLDADMTYYWRVDEVDSQGNTSKGPLWLFTSGAFLLVDDFEGYTDDDTAGEAIWQKWVDGFGVADNGAQVGYLLPPYCEQTIVHGGSQSMPLLYVNEAGVTNSEASLPLTAPKDWTQASVAELSLWFRGSSGNAAESLYVAVSNSAGAPAVAAYDDPSAATVRSWTPWRIPLHIFADQGINMTNVDKVGIGLGTKAGSATPGGSGMMYIDDIRLYPPEPEP